MKTLEEIQATEKRLRDDKKNGFCLCYALTGEVCTICKAHMDMDAAPYASCSPFCRIHKGDKFYEILNDKPKKVKSDKVNKFVTFTRKSNDENDYTKLFAVLSYIKKCKSVEQFWYAFEYQQNGNPHLHTIIHMKKGRYFRDIERVLKTKIEMEDRKGWMDVQTQKGTDLEAQNYLVKDISKTQSILSEQKFNYFLLYNIQLTNVIQQQT